MTIEQLIKQVREAAPALAISADDLERDVRALLQSQVCVRTTKIATALGITNNQLNKG